MDDTTQTHITGTSYANTIEHICLGRMRGIIIVFSRVAKQVKSIRRQKLYLIDVWCTTSLFLLWCGIIVKTKSKRKNGCLAILSGRSHRDIRYNIIDRISGKQVAPYRSTNGSTNSTSLWNILVRTIKTSRVHVLRSQWCQIVRCHIIISSHTREIGNEMACSLIIVTHLEIHITEHYVDRNKAKTWQELLGSTFPVGRTYTNLRGGIAQRGSLRSRVLLQVRG